MNKWKYTLPNSKALRQAIEDEESELIYREILKAYEWAESVFHDTFYEIQNVQDDLEVEAFDEDSVNMHLEDLWDYLDMRRVWVEL